MRVCPVCGSTQWESFYESSTNRIMTGDQRIGKGKLKKIYCHESGVVANESTFTNEELEVLYGEEYELNTIGKEEHYFYTSQGSFARSQVFFEWIAPYLPGNFNSLIEIGCGEGNLLERFAKKYPQKNIIGFDGSHKAAELAKSKGLIVQQKLIIGREELPQSDVFLLVNVVEHIEDIPVLISKLKKSLNDKGRIIFCLPIQDYGGYDIFFAEHVWHFTVKQFECILKKNGLNILHCEFDHPINHGIGLFVCEISKVQLECDPNKGGNLKKTLAFWESSFKNLDRLLLIKKYNKIAVFGGSEVFTLFITFTSLGEQNIVACIDDTKENGNKKHGIPIYKSEWLKENKVDLLLLAVNKKYHDQITNKLKDYNLNIHPIY